MGIGFLSRRITADAGIKFGSIDYSDSRIVNALCEPGLKERATYGRQIVTALKMVWWILLLPVLAPVRVVKRITGVVRRFVHGARSAVASACAESAVLLELTNRRCRVVALVSLLVLVYCQGVVGIGLWVCACCIWIGCFVPADARFFLSLRKNLASAWEIALEDGELEKTDIPQPVKVKNAFACRLAVRAISKVGLLSATRANALVYQKVILDDMRELNVRCADRVRVLPLAIAACLDRPKEVSQVESCIRQLYQTPGGL
nr:MAG: hypothetical protein [Tombusviridae sp.]